jgi:hypothetical protein
LYLRVAFPVGDVKVEAEIIVDGVDIDYPSLDSSGLDVVDVRFVLLHVSHLRLPQVNLRESLGDLDLELDVHLAASRIPVETDEEDTAGTVSLLDDTFFEGED